MGSDLVSACIFCSMFLFAPDPARLSGYSTELAASYSTLGRRTEPEPGLLDRSETTGKFIGIGAGFSRPAPAGLGAGTPELEWRARIVFAPSHDEQAEAGAWSDPIVAKGTGRDENFSLLLRYPVGARGSIEAAVSRRYNESTDLLTRGAGDASRLQERDLSADRTDWGLGWRHRFHRFEAALGVRNASPKGSHKSYGAFQITHGTFWGAEGEVRVSGERWTLGLSGEEAAGSLEVVEKNQPAFLKREFAARARLQAVSLAGSYRFEKNDVSLSVTYENSRLPFVSLAVTGFETAEFEQGYHPDSRTHQTAVRLEFGRRLLPAFRVKAFLRAAYGSESVRLTDPDAVLPERKLSIDREGKYGAGFSKWLGSPEIAIGVGADFGFFKTAS